VGGLGLGRRRRRRRGRGRGGVRGDRQAPPLIPWEITSMAMTLLTALVTVASTYFILQQWRTKATPQVRGLAT